MDIIVRRLPADRRGEDIVEPLLSDMTACIMRGRNEIDAASMSEDVDISMVPLPTAYVGALVETHDALYGESWKGKITGISHSASAGEMPTTTLRIARPV
jgi:hypothetical protein